MVSSYSLPFSWLNHRTTLYTGYSDNYVVELSECTLHLVYLYTKFSFLFHNQKGNIKILFPYITHSGKYWIKWLSLRLSKWLCTFYRFLWNSLSNKKEQFYHYHLRATVLMVSRREVIKDNTIPCNLLFLIETYSWTK